MLRGFCYQEEGIKQGWEKFLVENWMHSVVSNGHQRVPACLWGLLLSRQPLSAIMRAAEDFNWVFLTSYNNKIKEHHWQGKQRNRGLLSRPWWLSCSLQLLWVHQEKRSVCFFRFVPCRTLCPAQFWNSQEKHLLFCMSWSIALTVGKLFLIFSFNFPLMSSHNCSYMVLTAQWYNPGSQS